MPSVDLPGGDYNCTDVGYTDAHVCESSCVNDGSKCTAWTYVTRPPLVGRSRDERYVWCACGVSHFLQLLSEEHSAIASKQPHVHKWCHARTAAARR
jgi:hypothetical protein